MKSFIHIIITILVLQACTKSHIIDYYGARPVVEGYLSAGDSISIRISKEIPIGSTDTIAELITGLDVQIKTNQSIIKLHETSLGTYTSPEIIIVGKTYELEFNYIDIVVRAETTIPPIPIGFTLSKNTLEINQITFGGGGFPSGGRPTLPDPVLLTWENTDNSFYLISYVNKDTIQEPIFNGGPAIFRRGRIAFNRPVQSFSSQLDARQFEYYGNYEIGLLHVQPEYASLYENNNELSSLNLAPPPTNIVNGLGIFTGYAKVTKNLLVKKP